MKHANEKGFTLIELLVAMATASILMTAVISTYLIQIRSKNTQEVLTDMNQGTRAAFAIMNKELRSAGCDPTGMAGASIVNATANQISFTRDIGNGDRTTTPDTPVTSFLADGSVNGPNEQITYSLYVDSNGNTNLGRNTGGGNQPLVRNVDALNFQYLDVNGNITAVTADIRSVQVTVVARSGRNPGGFLHRYVDRRSYTNQQGDEILPPQNDGFRRLLLTSDINLLNLW